MEPQSSSRLLPAVFPQSSSARPASKTKRKAPETRDTPSVGSLFQKVESRDVDSDEDGQVAAIDAASGVTAQVDVPPPPVPPLTADEQEALRAFDMDQKHGPCMGPTRLERWARAKRLGLEPAAAIELILRCRPSDDGAHACMLANRL